MVPVNVQTLIVSTAPAPSIIVLQPVEDVTQEGKFRIVPIWVGMNEATQMGIALEYARFSRPMTHDLFLDALTNLDARIDHVVINLDARPSDALALAVRQKAPLYIEESVLERASFPYVLKRKGGDRIDERELTEFRTFLEKIAPDDFEA